MEQIEALFNLVKDTNQRLTINKMLFMINEEGLLIDRDERLKTTHEDLKSLSKEQLDLPVDYPTFLRLIQPNKDLMIRTFLKKLVVPTFQELCQEFDKIFENCKEIQVGKVNEITPQYAKADPAHWAVSLCTIDGQRKFYGKSDIPFTLEGCAKPFLYGFAMEHLGSTEIQKHIGTDFCIDQFDTLNLNSQNKPFNAMTDAGSILLCALLKSLSLSDLQDFEKFRYLTNTFKNLSAQEHVVFNNSVYMDRRMTSYRDYALMHQMNYKKCYPPKCNIDESLKLYFQMCSIEVTCESLSVMAATLANFGRCPLTEKEVFKEETVLDILAVLKVAGMEKYSGTFHFEVGLPAKSGISGGLMVIIPGKLGFCTWSPLLDDFNNSSRGLAFCKQFTANLSVMLEHVPLMRGSDKIIYKQSLVGSCKRNCTIFEAVQNGDVYTLSKFRDLGYNLNCTDYMGSNVLHIAAAYGHASCSEYLLNNFENMYSTKDMYGYTPLDVATQFKQTKIIDILKNDSTSENVPQV